LSKNCYGISILIIIFLLSAIFWQTPTGIRLSDAIFSFTEAHKQYLDPSNWALMVYQNPISLNPINLFFYAIFTISLGALYRFIRPAKRSDKN